MGRGQHCYKCFAIVLTNFTACSALISLFVPALSEMLQAAGSAKGFKMGPVNCLTMVFRVTCVVQKPSNSVDSCESANQRTSQEICGNKSRSVSSSYSAASSCVIFATAGQLSKTGACDQAGWPVAALLTQLVTCRNNGFRHC